MSIYNPGFSLEHFENKLGGAGKRRKSSKKRKSKQSKHHMPVPAVAHGAGKKRKSSKRKSKKSVKKSSHNAKMHMMPF